MHPTRLSVVITPAVILMLLASTLVGVDRLAFRDVGHFYTPLYEYVAARTQSEWIPLWNPLDQTGVPLVGETSTAVLYPLRYVLFSLPVSAEVAMAWYVALHLILASLAALAAARWAGATAGAANLAAAIYPLSGSVLFLHTNPPFLVGAAWLPLVLGSLLSRRPLNDGTRCLIGGVAMAMMILGGDPQTALHAMMAVSAVWSWRVIRSKARRSQDRQPELRRCGLVLIAAPMLAASLSTPQIAASVSWSRQSDRIRGVETVGWLQPPKAGSHRSDAFQFSVPPWHFAELLTPNAFGSHLPVSRRLSVLIPYDGRMWTPTLYMGMLTAIAVVCRLAQVCRMPLLGPVSRGRGEGVDVWLATAAASLLFCLGSFGVIWCVHACTGSGIEYDGAAGGPYWWLYHFVPGYSSFRYPAKWLPMFAIAASIVTARWFDRDAWRHPLVTTRATGLLLSVVLIACLVVSWLRLHPTTLTDALATWPADRYFGPLDVAGGLYQIQWSLLHSIIVLVVVMIVVRLQRIQRCSRHLAVGILFAVAVIDVAVSGFALIARISIQEEQQLLARASEVEQAVPIGSSSRRMRTQANGGWPTTWWRTSDPRRLTDVAASERITDFGRWHLSKGHGVLNNVVSIQNYDMALFWNAAAQLTRNMTPQQRTEFWHSVRRLLSIHHVVHSTDLARMVELPDRISVLADVQNIDERELGEDSGGEVFQFHTEWTTTDPRSARLTTFVGLLEEVRVRGVSAKPVIISAKQIPNVTVDSLPPAPRIETVTEQPSYVEIVLQNSSPGLLTRPTYQDGHWTAECKTAAEKTWSPLEVHRVNFLAQGVLLPRGCEAVRFIYKPSWFRGAVAVSGLAWILTLLPGIACVHRLGCGARRSPPANKPRRDAIVM